jgi:hypothetical protein
VGETNYIKKPDPGDDGIWGYGNSPYDQPITVNNFGDDPLLKALRREFKEPRPDLVALVDKETGRLIANARQS